MLLDMSMYEIAPTASDDTGFVLVKLSGEATTILRLPASSARLRKGVRRCAYSSTRRAWAPALSGRPISSQ